ncbi:chemotaxis protein CheB [Dyella humi]|uniref:protein-glutamate methylesterase n=1 Tax=Dyella humi TaxID=1770547 RepID=A0ABW8IH26_9GAMM
MKASSKVVAVALLFDDVELGSHLRAALSEHGARIAHEGPISSFDVAKLRQAGVDVLVVNLDDSVDEAALDLIYELVASGDIPVVFNDAQASRALDGWDRARWARHLAAKTLNSDTIDPPRPEHARAVEVPVAPAVAEPQAEVEPVVAAPSVETPMEAEPGPESELEPLLAPVESEPVADVLAMHEEHEEHEAALTPESSETLASELEALLAFDEAQANPEDEFGSLKFTAEDELPALHDGNFGWGEQDASVAHEDIPTAPGFAPAPAPVPAPARLEAPAFNINLGHLSLASLDEEFTPPVIEKATLAQQTPSPVAPEWGFVEEDDAAKVQPSSDKASFGVEKVSATDYLAPDVEFLEDESPVEPGMSLELVSMEEAIAPNDEYQAFESHLQELDAAFARLLVLGAARDSGASLASFLGALPGDLKMPILLTQHHGQDALEQLIESLATRCTLPIKVAAPGMRARTGEVVVVPRGQQVRITRDGRVELSAANDDVGGQSPSIDSSFTMAASVFGRDALAIVFAGHATDAVAGAQAIHDRGGQVWVEASTGDHYTDMVNGVMAERLASFSGSPQELAVRLVEDFR